MDKHMAINRSLFFSFGSGTAWYRALKIQHGRMSNQTRTLNTDPGGIYPEAGNLCKIRLNWNDKGVALLAYLIISQPPIAMAYVTLT